jgi:hypothetical protein
MTEIDRNGKTNATTNGGVTALERRSTSEMSAREN